MPLSAGPVDPGAAQLRRGGLPLQDRARLQARHQPAVTEAVLGALDQGVFVHDGVGRPVIANPAAERILALAHRDLLSPAAEGVPCSLVHEDGTPWEHASLPSARALATGQAQPAAIIGFPDDGGHLHWLSVITTPVRMRGASSVAAVVSTVTDITELHAARAAAAEAEARYRLLAEASVDVVSVLSADDTVRYVSPASNAVLGKAPAELIGMSHTAGFVHAEEHGARRTALETVRSTGAATSYTARFLMADGTWRWMETWLRALSPGDPITEVLAITRDVDDQHRYSAEIEQLALTDALTGLANRAQFAGRLERVLRRISGPPGNGQAGAGLLLVDLDEFKAINDTYGHQVGDQLLQAVAARLSESSRPGDTVARLGGDEFAVLLHHLDEPAGASAAAQRLTEALGMPYPLAGVTLSCTASIGLALATPGEPTQALYRRADEALYAAKAAGRHTWAQAPVAASVSR